MIGSLAGGMSKEEVMEAYGLTKPQIDGALAYATDLVQQAEVFPIGENTIVDNERMRARRRNHVVQNRCSD